MSAVNSWSLQLFQSNPDAQSQAKPGPAPLSLKFVPLATTAIRLEAISSRLEAISTIGWTPSLVGWRPSLLGCTYHTCPNDPWWRKYGQHLLAFGGACRSYLRHHGSSGRYVLEICPRSRPLQFMGGLNPTRRTTCELGCRRARRTRWTWTCTWTHPCRGVEGFPKMLEVPHLRESIGQVISHQHCILYVYNLISSRTLSLQNETC